MMDSTKHAACEGLAPCKTMDLCCCHLSAHGQDCNHAYSWPISRSSGSTASCRPRNTWSCCSRRQPCCTCPPPIWLAAHDHPVGQCLVYAHPTPCMTRYHIPCQQAMDQECTSACTLPTCHSLHSMPGPVVCNTLLMSSLHHCPSNFVSPKKLEPLHPGPHLEFDCQAPCTPKDGCLSQ